MQDVPALAEAYRDGTRIVHRRQCRQRHIATAEQPTRHVRFVGGPKK
jgi:hypothetical protein